jgi:hypothetical protein
MADAFETIAIRTEAIVHERTAILTHRRKHAAGIDEQVRRGRMTEEEAAMCKRCVAAFADDLAIGLHVDGTDPDGVRDAMRGVIRAHVKQQRETRSDG